MAIDPQVEQYLERLNGLGLTPIHELTPAEVRANFAASIDALFGPVDPVFAVEDRETDTGVPVRIYRPGDDPEPGPVLIFFHGGGWVVGSIETHDGIARALANRSGCAVVSVDYRLAPEHRFPAAIDDAWSATRWVLANAAELGLDPGRVAVGGDSAGGTLAAVVARRARDAGIPLALQLLVYPVADHSFETGSYSEFAEGHSLTREGMRWYWSHYLGDADGLDPDASPARESDLTGLAPAFIATAGLDPLRDEGEAYARRLEDAGVSTVLVRYDGMIHGFLRMPAVIDRAGDALDDLAAVLSGAFS
ncbi:MAG TPA: alpha/beta hydrolase [Gaiellaceae bacterium]|nr:alpha/beta hydrolase [Gaiellaceae bacterium]